MDSVFVKCVMSNGADDTSVKIFIAISKALGAQKHMCRAHRGKKTVEENNLFHFEWQQSRGANNYSAKVIVMFESTNYFH